MSKIDPNAAVRMPWDAIPATTRLPTIQGEPVAVNLGVSSELGGVGVLFELINLRDRPDVPINILEARSAAGCGWQTSYILKDQTHNSQIIVFNQAAGNSVSYQGVPYQWGFPNKFAISDTGLGADYWNPLVSDHVDSVGTGPLQDPPSGFLVDDGRLQIGTSPKQTPYGNVVDITNLYTLRSRFNQYWEWWTLEQAFYINRKVSLDGDLRVYLCGRDGGWRDGPIRPQCADFVIRGDHSRIESHPDTSIRDFRIDPISYAVLVWSIFGLDVGVAVIPPEEKTCYPHLVLEGSQYHGEGSIAWHLFIEELAPARFVINEPRGHGVRYLVGTLEQLAHLGYAIDGSTHRTTCGAAPADYRPLIERVELHPHSHWVPARAHSSHTTKIAKDDFVIGFWAGPPNAEISIKQYQLIKDAGFNTVSASVNEHYPPVMVKHLLAVAEHVGLSAIVNDERIAGYRPCDVRKNTGPDWTHIEDRVNETVADCGGSKILRGYWIGDEPGHDKGYFSQVKRLVAALRLKDPDRIAYMNLLPTYGINLPDNYPSYVEDYVSIVRPDVISFDNYLGRDGFTNNCRVVRDIVAKYPGTIYWAVINALLDGSHIAPSTNIDDMRWCAMEAIRYGARGINYFLYWMPDCPRYGRQAGIIDATTTLPTSRYAEVAKLNGDIQSLVSMTGEVLFGRVRDNVNGDLWLLDSAHPETHLGPKWDCVNMPSPSDPKTTARRLACSQSWEQMKLDMPGYRKVAALDQAPEGMNGFYLAARNDLVGRTFHVLNVVKNAGTLYEVSLGKYPKPIGPAGWDDPRRKHIVGTAFEADGFWVSIED